MKTIALIAVIAVLFLEASGAVPQSSVGGPMTLALVFFIAGLAVGIHEAWSKKMGVRGWIVSIFASLAGGFVAANLGSMLMGTILSHANLEGSLAETGGPLLYAMSAGMMLLALLGSWIALRIVSRRAERAADAAKSTSKD